MFQNRQETINEINSSIMASMNFPTGKPINELESVQEAESPQYSRNESPHDLPRMRLANEEERKMIRLVKYYDEEEAIIKLKDCLFNPRAQLNRDLLNDDKIFRMLQDGLSEDQVKWIKKRRQDLIAIIEASVCFYIIIILDKRAKSEPRSTGNDQVKTNRVSINSKVNKLTI